jgi:hypothetical protein
MWGDGETNARGDMVPFVETGGRGMNLNMSHHVRCPKLEAGLAILSDACVSVEYCRLECPHYGGLIDWSKNTLICKFSP